MPAFRSNMPSYRQLANEAKEGDYDAAYMLAKRAPHKGFLPWLAHWVKPGEMTVEIFDTFYDSYQRMELEKLDSQLPKADEEAA